MKRPTKEDLEKLPHRAIVAYSARCARRVQPLFDWKKDRLKHFLAVDRAIESAESFAAGDEISAAYAYAFAARADAGIDWETQLDDGHLNIVVTKARLEE